MFMEFSVALPHQKPWQMHGIYNSTYHCEHPKRSKARDRDHPRAVARELHFVNVAPMTYKHAKETTFKGKKFWSKYQHHGCSLPFRGCTLNLKLSTCGLLASFSCCRRVPQKGMIAFYTSSVRVSRGWIFIQLDGLKLLPITILPSKIFLWGLWGLCLFDLPKRDLDNIFAAMTVKQGQHCPVYPSILFYTV